MIIETFRNVSRTAKAEIHTDGFKGRYMVEKFDGVNEETGELIFVRRVWRINSRQAARDCANNWIMYRR